MSRTLFTSLAICFVSIFIVSCKAEKEPRKLNLPQTDLAQEYLIPKPSRVQATHTAFPLDQYTVIRTQPDTLDFAEVGNYLAEKLQGITNIQTPVNSEFPQQESVIFIRYSDSLAKINKESYSLHLE